MVRWFQRHSFSTYWCGEPLFPIATDNNAVWRSTTRDYEWCQDRSFWLLWLEAGKGIMILYPVSFHNCYKIAVTSLLLGSSHFQLVMGPSEKSSHIRGSSLELDVNRLWPWFCIHMFRTDSQTHFSHTQVRLGRTTEKSVKVFSLFLSPLKVFCLPNPTRSSLVAQSVESLPAMRETRFDWIWSSFGQEDPLEKGMATHSSILAWRFPCREEPSGLQSMGSQRVGHDWVTNNFTTYTYLVSRWILWIHFSG